MCPCIVLIVVYYVRYDHHHAAALNCSTQFTLSQPSCNRPQPSAAQCLTRKSQRIKIAAMHLYKDDILSKLVILDYLSISSQMFDHIVALWNATGEVAGKQMVFEATPISFPFQILSTSSTSSNAAQIGFLKSFSTCFKLITSFQLD